MKRAYYLKKEFQESLYVKSLHRLKRKLVLVGWYTNGFNREKAN